MNLFTPIDSAVIQRLVLRRQFILAPRKLAQFSHWNAKTVGGKWVVHAHPDLGLTQAKRGPLEVTLLGYCLDPDDPGRSDDDICASLLVSVDSVDNLVQKTHRLVGRWIMIFCRQDGIWLFSDPCGLRSLYYVADHPEGPWCFSQPEAVKELLNLEPNREAQAEFLSTDYYLNCIEPWWPGYDSPYEGVKHLAPNHYLDARTWKATRFWPREKRETKTPAEALPQVGKLLAGGLAAAARRFPLALPLTSGWDSRLVLAASKPFRNDIFFYTLRYNSHKQDRRDLDIPPRLLARLGLTHHAIECPAGMARAFAEVYFRNVSLANYAHGPIVFGLFRNFPQDHLCLKAMGGEIGRCFFHRYQYPESIDARTLTVLAQGGTRQTSYALRHFERWLKETRPVAQHCAYDLLDLFHWEQKVGNLVAACEAECDIVYEMLAPYNCRALLETLLAVPAKFRRHPAYLFHHQLMTHLWPETLREPVNPSSLAETLQSELERRKKSAKTVLKNLKLFNTAKRVYRFGKER